MLEEMRLLALDYLSENLGNEIVNFNELTPAGMPRLQRTPAINGFLVEASEKIERAYILIPDKLTNDLVRLEASDLDKEKKMRLPFVKPAGARSPAIGPVFKRTYQQNKAGPSQKHLQSSRKAFQAEAKKATRWQSYFQEISNVLSKPRLKLPSGEIIQCGEKEKYADVLNAAVEAINERQTVFLAVADEQGRWPGDVDMYAEYLASNLAQNKYTTREAPAKESGDCALCQTKDTTVYANALKGAGINLMNIDRAGAFPGIDTSNAWKSFAMCVDCADLLYIYKNHVAKDFIANVAGSKALIIPSSGFTGDQRKSLIKEMKRYVAAVDRGVEQRELNILDLIAEAPEYAGVTSLTLLWAKFGQNIEDLQGAITDILPSRLHNLSQINREFNRREHTLFPTVEHLDYKLGMNILGEIFKRPGGKKTTSLNASKRLFQLKRNLLAALYHGQTIPATRFWEESLITARCYLLDAITEDSAKIRYYKLHHETAGEYKGSLTLASWIRHLAKLIYYFKTTEVFPMQGNNWYQPQLETLKPYFGPESGIDSPAKGFAFLLGIVYGKLLMVQGARGVNVSSNALTWLKRLTLSGKDLPDLYVKVREKLLAYGTERSEKVRDLLQEIGHLGAKLGDNIKLDETQACYYILLGQSLAREVLGKDKEEEDLEA